MSMLMNSCRRGRGALALALLLLAGASGAAAPVATIVAGDEPPAIMCRPGPDGAWKLASGKEAFSAGSQVLGGMGATILSADGAVEARFVGNIARLSPFPILESTIILNEAKDCDFAFTMERGRIDLINHKKEGEAKIKVTVRDRTAELTLMEPGARAVIEMYGRWPKGVRFTKTPKDTDVPPMALVLIAVKGEVRLKGKEHVFSLKAPPGPALLLVDSLGDESPQVHHLDKVPEWVDAGDAALAAKLKAGLKVFREQAAKSSIGEALLQLALSDDEDLRRLAVILLGALDDLEHFAIAMTKSTHPDVRENGIVVLRHWIGRAPGQDLKLYQALIDKAKYKPAEAETALQLLHSFSDADLNKPHTYESLIALLESDRPLLRSLAHWHLVRLVPSGKSIDFNVSAPKEEREKAVAAWRKLVPEGTLPGQAKQKP
jgi:hypothetical protein